MQPEFKIIDHKVIFNTGKSIDFSNTIKHTLVIRNMLIVIVEYFEKKITNENVYGIDLNRQALVWQIENNTFYDCPFLDMIEKQNFLYLRNWCHYVLKVNPQTGEVYDKIYDQNK